MILRVFGSDRHDEQFSGFRVLRPKGRFDMRLPTAPNPINPIFVVVSLAVFFCCSCDFEQTTDARPKPFGQFQSRFT